MILQGFFGAPVCAKYEHPICIAISGFRDFSADFVRVFDLLAPFIDVDCIIIKAGLQEAKKSFHQIKSNFVLKALLLRPYQVQCGRESKVMTMNSTERIDLLLKETKGFLKTADAVSFGVSKTVLCDYVRKNELVRVAHGLYMSQDAWDDGMYVIQYRYPKAIFSHETALFLLNIADREPSPFSVTFITGTNTARLSKEGIKTYKIKPELFEVGLINADSPSGHSVRVYNAERTICDLFRSRRSIETQELQAAVKNYVNQKDKNIPLLMRYAKSFSVEKTARQYLEVLL